MAFCNCIVTKSNFSFSENGKKYTISFIRPKNSSLFKFLLNYFHLNYYMYF